MGPCFGESRGSRFAPLPSLGGEMHAATLPAESGAWGSPGLPLCVPPVALVTLRTFPRPISVRRAVLDEANF